MFCNCPNHLQNSETNGDKRVLSRRDVVQGLAAGSLLLMGGCATNAETGRSQLILVDDATLVSLSASAWTDVKKQTPISTNSKLISRVTNVGRRIAAVSNITNANWEYQVFDSNTVNAFVLPGGKVGVYRGLLDLVQNDDQLACVLGHETGHVSGRHAAERMSQGVAAQFGMAAVQIGTSSMNVSDAAKSDIMQALGMGVQYGVLLPFSRSQELEADKIGLHYMARAGYNPRESIKLWQRMASVSKNNTPELLSTHPSDSTRIQRLQEELVKMGYS